jgi:7-keto-8-aminopelargonate synthetase-like enzyme
MQRMSAAGLAPPAHPSPIIPVILGPEHAAIEASSTLLARGLWVPAIRPPTVPTGTSRLRITLSAVHRDDDVTALIDALHSLSLPESITAGAR